MFRLLSPTFIPWPRFPRVRGDVPPGFWVLEHIVEFSPRARGCSCCKHLVNRDRRVFPACAGMFLEIWNPQGTAECFPRVRGDVPIPGHSVIITDTFYPRARGCSFAFRLDSDAINVFPACAGMFRFWFLKRTRLCKFSPRARGCSSRQRGQRFDIAVFPACAGMFRFRYSSTDMAQLFSPRARGCSVRMRSTNGRNRVFPACAGMFRVA